ncbi:hypothetical protein [Deinococcus sp.]|uniref:hypothetical protein n=1 Tax=Deinococcus sp. TaxID=47478 RepID=UPI0025EBD9DF|nr:hypothetical protein [Deinococcus sp.]
MRNHLMACTTLMLISLSGLAGGAGPLPALGMPLNVVGHSASLTALTTDPGGAPVLAWVEQGPSGGRNFNRLRSARWDGQRWQPLGGVLNENPAHNAAQLSAVRGPGGQPWLGWSEDAGTAHVDSYLISRWDGRAWSDPSKYAVRRNLSDAGKSRAFAVTAQNEPYLTWTNIYYPGASAGVVQPFTWQGRRWAENAKPLNHSVANAAFFPAAASSPQGTVYTAWLEGRVSHSDVYVARQEQGGTWTNLGGALNLRPNTYTFAPQLRAGAGGALFAAWLEDQGGVDNLFAKRWTGQTWVSLGTSLNSDPKALAERPNLALDARSQPLLAWSEGQEGGRRVYAKRWTGQRWQLLGGGPLNQDARQDAHSASITADAQGRVVVAWCEKVGPEYRVMVRRF